MSTGVELPVVDVEGWVREQAEAERALLRLAQEERPERDDLDYLAATELLFKYIERDPFQAPDVLAAIERGARTIAHRVLDEGRPNISPLMYFGRNGGDGQRRKDLVNLSRLILRKSIGWHLNAADAKQALTTECGKESPRDEWPETLGEVETYLVDYVLVRFLRKSSAESEGGEVGKSDSLKVANAADLELARDYVRDSFAWLPWNNPEAPVTYPVSWERAPLDT
jgi:hypothetical protein